MVILAIPRQALTLSPYLEPIRALQSYVDNYKCMWITMWITLTDCVKSWPRIINGFLIDNHSHLYSDIDTHSHVHKHYLRDENIITHRGTPTPALSSRIFEYHTPSIRPKFTCKLSVRFLLTNIFYEVIHNLFHMFIHIQRSPMSLSFFKKNKKINEYQSVLILLTLIVSPVFIIWGIFYV
jgi:hypothetical protein